MRIRRDHFGLDASTRLALATVSALVAFAALLGIAIGVACCLWHGPAR